MAKRRSKKRKPKASTPPPSQRAPPVHNEFTIRDGLARLPPELRIMISDETYRLVLLEGIHKGHITISAKRRLRCLMPPHPWSERFEDFRREWSFFCDYNTSYWFCGRTIPATEVEQVNEIRTHLPELPFIWLHAIKFGKRPIVFANLELLKTFVQYFLSRGTRSRMSQIVQIRLRVTVAHLDHSAILSYGTPLTGRDRNRLLAAYERACWGTIRDTVLPLQHPSQACGFTFALSLVLPLSFSKLCGVRTATWLVQFAQCLPRCFQVVEVRDRVAHVVFTATETSGNGAPPSLRLFDVTPSLIFF